MANKVPYGSPPPQKVDVTKEHTENLQMHADNQLRMVKHVQKLHKRVGELETGSGHGGSEHYKLANTYLYNVRLVMIFLLIVAGILAFVGTVFLVRGNTWIAILLYALSAFLIWKGIRHGTMKDDLPEDYEQVE